MNRLSGICTLLWSVLGALLPAAKTAAQDNATTLHRLSRASVIAEVKVLAIQEERGTRQVSFKTLRSLKGVPPAAFTLRDTADRMCGNTLDGLVPGCGLIAFLEHDTAGTRLTIPSPRALVPLQAEVRDHVKGLLRAGSPVQLLTVALSSRHPRVRQDAAHALTLLPDLPQATGTDRDRILGALDTAMALGDKSRASLIHVAQRLRLSAAVDTLLPRCLAGEEHGLEPMLVDAIATIDGARAARRLLAALPAHPRQQRVAVRLLARCGGQEARLCLQRLLMARDGDVQVQAAAALLDQGHPAEDIRRLAGANVLDSGQRLRQRALQFRSIQPRKDG